MKFYKIKFGYHRKSGYPKYDKYGNLAASPFIMYHGVLLTEREMEYYRFPKCAADVVYIDKNKTVWLDKPWNGKWRYDPKDYNPYIIEQYRVKEATA